MGAELARNRALWTVVNSQFTDEHADEAWTAYLSAVLARQGARPVGVDLTPAQLATAARCQDRFGLAFPLIGGNAEKVRSGMGASIWWSASTAPACGVTQSVGSPKQRGCFGLVGDWRS